jgi:hypothetical protein
MRGPTLVLLRALLPGRWPSLALSRSLVISTVVLAWDAHWLFV